MDEKVDINDTVTVPLTSDEPTGGRISVWHQYKDFPGVRIVKDRHRVFFSFNWTRTSNEPYKDITESIKRQLVYHQQSTGGLSGFDAFSQGENFSELVYTFTGEDLLEELHVSNTEKLESSLAEARINRAIVSALMDKDGLGLHVLVQLRSALRMSATELATAIRADLDSMAGVLAQLVRLGIVDLREGLFYYTDTGAKYLHRVEDETGVRLAL